MMTSYKILSVFRNLPAVSHSLGAMHPPYNDDTSATLQSRKPLPAAHLRTAVFKKIEKLTFRATKEKPSVFASQPQKHLTKATGKPLLQNSRHFNGFFFCRIFSIRFPSNNRPET